MPRFADVAVDTWRPRAHESDGLTRAAWLLWSVPAVWSRQVLETCCSVAISACGCGVSRTWLSRAIELHW